MSKKVAVVSLGCPKNQVDAEVMLKKLADAGFEIGVAESEADAIIINTCGFIEDAKKEAIENILEAASYKKDGNLKALIVTGCLAERYKEDITEEIPEVDMVVGLGSNKDIAKLTDDAINGNIKNSYGEKDLLPIDDERILGGAPYSAYLKISEGCNNRCTYCAIPLIRGNMRSRTVDSIIEEAKKLTENGVKEITLVAQDTTAYGEDLYKKPMLASLLKELCKIEKLHWVRILYTYPERITDELLEVMRDEKKIVKYLDIPLQHVDGELLRRMNRKGNIESITALIDKIRNTVPDITIRTTFITGFPGETDEQFSTLHQFVKDTRFDRLGCFTYSPEEDTPAATFDGQIDEQTKQDRMELIMDSQMTISAEKNAEKVGKTVEVLVEGYDDYIKCYFGRTPADAPEIDGKIFFLATRPLSFGEFVEVEVNDSIEYDLLGEMLDESAQ